MNNTLEVVRFAETVEKVCIGLVEAGKMTKDLALLIDEQASCLTTGQYLDAVDAELKKRMGSPQES
jgi:isocitrate dehydrogenase